VPATKLQNTEVQAFHGCGLAFLPSLGNPFCVGSHFLNKLRLSLFVIILIL